MSDLETLESVAHLFDVYVKKEDQETSRPDPNSGHYSCACEYRLNSTRYYYTTHIYNFDVVETPISFVWSKTELNRKYMEKRFNDLTRSIMGYGATNIGTYQWLEKVLDSMIQPALIVDHLSDTTTHCSEAAKPVRVRDLWTPTHYDRYVDEGITDHKEVMVYHVYAKSPGAYIDPTASVEFIGRDMSTWDSDMWANMLRVTGKYGLQFYESKVGVSDYRKLTPPVKPKKKRNCRIR